MLLKGCCCPLGFLQSSGAPGDTSFRRDSALWPWKQTDGRLRCAAHYTPRQVLGRPEQVAMTVDWVKPFTEICLESEFRVAMGGEESKGYIGNPFYCDYIRFCGLGLRSIISYNLF